MAGDWLNWIWMAAGAGAAVLTLPGTIELLALTLGALLPMRRAKAADMPLRLAALVPAHNEEKNVAETVTSLRASTPSPGEFSVVVIADNCTDATAERAREAGARVIERNDAERRGKGYALDYAFGILLAEGYDAVAVVDADTVVEKNFAVEMHALMADGADAAQCGYLVKNADESRRTRLMNVALMAFNVLRPRGRAGWGWSCGILGNGFALSRRTLEAVPYDARSVVEDLEYHLRLVRRGRRVRFAGGAIVRAEMPAGGRGAETQRARWDGGRFGMIRMMAPALAREVASGKLRLIEPLLELLLLPLAFHVLLLLAALVAPYAPARIYAAAGLAVVALHLFAALVVGGGGWRDVAALATAPFYILWKAALLPKMFRAARSDAAWVRTERKGAEAAERDTGAKE
ncbi:MAG: glycosyltransferase [Acidobacteria bacterium]|nr:glycosyltransferase [Acidobacteriota bacterium]MCW5969228.1 glycosyltransferase [Blastocatellales bacterium]